MAQPIRNASPSTEGEESAFDFSTPEGIEALKYASSLVLELREELQHDAATRRLHLYERTLGLAVAPVLLRRLIIRIRRARAFGQGRDR